MGSISLGGKKVKTFMYQGKKVVRVTRVYDDRVLSLETPLQSYNLVSGSYLADGLGHPLVSAAGMLLAGAGNNNYYNRTIMGKSNIRVRFVHDSGANNYNGTIWATEAVAYKLKMKVTVATMHGNNHDRYEPYGFKEITIVRNPNFSISISGSGVTSTTIGLDQHKMIWQYGFPGGWLQFWAVNYRDTVRFAIGGGTSGPSAVMIVESVAVDK